MPRRPPPGMTPPTPGLDHEEPEQRREVDIPSDDGRASSAAERSHRERQPDEQAPEQEIERE